MLKLELWKRYKHDRDGYTNAKTEFIKKYTDIAKASTNIIHSLFIIYIFVLLRITVFRSGFRLYGLFENGQINLTFLQDYLPLIQEGRWLRFIYLFVGNIIWFVPFGAYLMWSKRAANVIHSVSMGLLFSLIIEFLQYAFGTGISELDDLFLNALGTWIGAWGYGFIRYLRRNKDMWPAE